MALNTVATETLATRVLESLESRLRRVEFLVTGDISAFRDEANANAHTTAKGSISESSEKKREDPMRKRIRRLEQALQRLATQSQGVREMLDFCEF